MNSSKNARFWVSWRHGIVKITLKPGQTRHAAHGQQEDEGWSRTAMSWEHQGDTVASKGMVDGCDCDGRIREYWEAECPITELNAQEFSGVHYPKWRVTESERRDFQAEAAGY